MFRSAGSAPALAQKDLARRHGRVRKLAEHAVHAQTEELQVLGLRISR